MEKDNLGKFVENMAADMGEMQNDMSDISMDLDEICNDIRNLLKEIQSMDNSAKKEDKPALEPMTVLDLRDIMQSFVVLHGAGSQLVMIDHKPFYPDAVSIDFVENQINIDTSKCGKGED